MAGTKIDYGIDLGTSNTAVARMKQGEFRVIRSERYLKDTTPSCVHFNRKKTVFVGDDALNKYKKEALEAFANPGNGDDLSVNSFIEFKRTMGTDKSYFSPNMNRSFLSEDLSAEVLKKMKSHVQDENLSAAVITVPAKFRQNQIDATQRAAVMAGFTYCELLQEPVAASMAYGIDAKDARGNWLVFDFGGGTFDVALMAVSGGVMKVLDTGGDNHLGGKDVDYALVDGVFIPWLKRNHAIEKILSDEKRRTLLREALKWHAEEAKIAMSTKDRFEIHSDESVGLDDEGREMEFDLAVTLEDFETAACPIYERAVTICEKLLADNHLDGSDLEKIILVGGPTWSRTLKKMLKERISTEVDSRIDPITAVAHGAALYASTREIPSGIRKKDRSKMQLTLDYPETTLDSNAKVGIEAELDRPPGNLSVEVARSDGAWASGRMSFQSDSISLRVLLNEDKPNDFAIKLFDESGERVPCEPDEFAIVHGFLAAKPTLPHSLCIGAIDSNKGRQILIPLEGLEKNRPLPAKGKGIFRTQKRIRAGNSGDIVKIPIYEGDPHTRATLNEWASLVTIAGKDIEDDLPENADIEIEIEIDSSRRMTLTAWLPYIDETIEAEAPENRQKDYDAAALSEEISAAWKVLNMMESESSLMDIGLMNEFIKVDSELGNLSKLLDAGRGDYDTRIQVMERLREVLKDLDMMEEEILWPDMERKLDSVIREFCDCVETYGCAEEELAIDSFRERSDKYVEQTNLKAAKGLLKEIRMAGLRIMSREIGLWVRYVKDFYTKFDRYEWKDKNAAMNLINEARTEIAENPSRSKIEKIVRKLAGLLPETWRTEEAEYDKELLKK